MNKLFHIDQQTRTKSRDRETQTIHSSKSQQLASFFNLVFMQPSIQPVSCVTKTVQEITKVKGYVNITPKLY